MPWNWHYLRRLKSSRSTCGRRHVGGCKFPACWCMPYLCVQACWCMFRLVGETALHPDCVVLQWFFSFWTTNNFGTWHDPEMQAQHKCFSMVRHIHRIGQIREIDVLVKNWLSCMFADSGRCARPPQLWRLSRLPSKGWQTLGRWSVLEQTLTRACTQFPKLSRNFWNQVMSKGDSTSNR